jgi:hypothetical protein
MNHYELSHSLTTETNHLKNRNQNFSFNPAETLLLLKIIVLWIFGFKIRFLLRLNKWLVINHSESNRQFRSGLPDATFLNQKYQFG